MAVLEAIFTYHLACRQLNFSTKKFYKCQVYLKQIINDVSDQFRQHKLAEIIKEKKFILFQSFFDGVSKQELFVYKIRFAFGALRNQDKHEKPF